VYIDDWNRDADPPECDASKVNEDEQSLIKFIPRGKKRRIERARRSQVQQHHQDQERQQQQGQKIHSELGKSATTSRRRPLIIGS